MASQYGQDIFVLEVLRGLRGGFFLDSGAADGVQGSNTRLLEFSFDWTGICVEPNDTFFAKLVRNRRCYCLNCCLYDREGSVEFLESANFLGGILEAYHPACLHYAKTFCGICDAVAGGLATASKVARTTRSVLRECGAPPIIDYWSLDTEGSELAILKSFPFDEYSFRVLTVEHNRLPARDEIRFLLESRGYRRIRTLEIDDCYVKDGSLPLLSKRSSAWTRLGRGRRFGQ